MEMGQLGHLLGKQCIRSIMMSRGRNGEKEVKEVKRGMLPSALFLRKEFKQWDKKKLVRLEITFLSRGLTKKARR